MTKKTVLCIEDNPDNTLLVRRIIENIGYAFLWAQNGKTGLEMAERMAPDLILLDINLPDLDGYEIARRLRSSEIDRLTVVPIIAVTANALRGDAEKVLAAGCDVYMSKPINIHELWERVDAILGAGQNTDKDSSTE